MRDAVTAMALRVAGCCVVVVIDSLLIFFVCRNGGGGRPVLWVGLPGVRGRCGSGLGIGIGIPGRFSGVGVGRVRGRWGAVNTRMTSTNSVFLGWKASASKSPCDVPVMFLVVFGRSSPGSVRVRSGSEGPAFQVGVCVCFGEGLHGSALDPFPFDEIRLLFPRPSLPSSDCGLLSRRAFRLEWPFGFLRGGGGGEFAGRVDFSRFDFVPFVCLAPPFRVAAVSINDPCPPHRPRFLPAASQTIWASSAVSSFVVAVLVPLLASPCTGCCFVTRVSPFCRFKPSPPGW